MNSVLQGGKRRRRRAGKLVLLLVLAAPLAVAAAIYLTITSDHVGRSSVVAASRPAPAPLPSRPSPVIPSEAAPQIRLSSVDAFHLRLRKPAHAGLVFDVDTGDVLWQLHPLRRLPIASLTKIMTALIVVERTRPSERVRITRSALHYQGSGVGVLPKGRRVRLETLLNGLLIVSGNDAGIALADHLAGSMRRFVRLMNGKAQRLGLGCTHFASSHGLEPGNRSCARDLAVLTRLAMRESRIRRIVRRRQAAFRFPVKGGHLFLYGHNPLIRAGYRGAIGLKTGYTSEAGHCFVGVARRGGHTLGVILLDSPNMLKQSAKLLNLGFAATAG